MELVLELEVLLVLVLMLVVEELHAGADAAPHAIVENDVVEHDVIVEWRTSHRLKVVVVAAAAGAKRRR